MTTGFEFHKVPLDSDEETIGPFKVLLVGDAGVGKTSLLRTFVDEDFNRSYVSTIGIDFRRKLLQLGQRKYVKLQVWDTAGQERFRGLVASYFRGCDAVVFVYDITDKVSFQNIVNWIETVREICQIPGFLLSESIQCMVVGNKSDLKHGRQVTREEAKIFADTFNMDLFETSAKQNLEVTEMFSALSEALWMDWVSRWSRQDVNNLLGRTFGPTIQLGSDRQSDSMYHFQPHPAELSHLNTNMDILGVECAWEAKEDHSPCCR